MYGLASFPHNKYAMTVPDAKLCGTEYYYQNALYNQKYMLIVDASRNAI